jgi:hypothetical protein
MANEQNNGHRTAPIKNKNYKYGLIIACGVRFARCARWNCRQKRAAQDGGLDTG